MKFFAMGKYLPFQFPHVIFIAWLMRQKLTENIQMEKKQKFDISTFASVRKWALAEDLFFLCH